MIITPDLLNSEEKIDYIEAVQYGDEKKIALYAKKVALRKEIARREKEENKAKGLY